MMNLAKQYHRTLFGLRFGRPPITFTSFVIASPEARIQISGTEDPYLPEHWWANAQRSGYIDIGTHSWNHVHPCVAEVREQKRYLDAFDLIDDPDEARKQIAQATQYVYARTGHPAARLFAYPNGRRSAFMVRDYLPHQSDVLGAFTTDGEPVHPGSSAWEIPRYVCNDHWKSTDDLQRLLRFG